jgi:hypothetical protein
MKNKKRNLVIYKIVFILFLLMNVVGVSAADWQEPTCDPPECNVSSPLNQGKTAQFKKGALHLGNTEAMDGYLFSVKSGKSYFEDTLDIKNGMNIEGVTVINDDLMIDEGMLNINNTEDSSVLYVQASQANAVAIQGSSLTGVGIKGVTAEGIGVDGNAGGTGIGVYGWSLSAAAVGVVGFNNAKDGLAGRFDNIVRFNSYTDPVVGPDYTEITDYTEINGGTAVFSNVVGEKVTISPPDIILERGIINLNDGKIINLATPTENGDATNKEYVDNAVLNNNDDDWEIAGNNIYKESGNVGIGLSDPSSALEVNGLVTLPCQNSVSNPPVTGLKIGDNSYIYDSSCSLVEEEEEQENDDNDTFQTLHIDSEEVIDISSLRGIKLQVKDKYGINIDTEGAVTLGGWLQSVPKNSYIQNSWNISGFYTGAAAVGKEVLENQEMEMALFGRTGNTISTESDGATYGGVGIRARGTTGLYSYIGVHGYAKGNVSSEYSYGVLGESEKGTALRGNLTGPTGNILVLDSPYFASGNAFVVDAQGNTTMQGDLLTVADAFQVGGNFDVAEDITVGGDFSVIGDSILGDENAEVYMPGGGTLDNGLLIRSGGLQINGGNLDITNNDLNVSSGNLLLDGDAEIIGKLEASTIEPYYPEGVVPEGGIASIEFDANGNVVITLPSSSVVSPK